MDAWKKERLIDAGIDVDGALERFMGNDALLDRFLGKFLGDTNYALLSEAIETADPDKALTASHTLKGVCGNLSMPELFRLRRVRWKRCAPATGTKPPGLMPEISRAYETVVSAIKEGRG